MRRWQERESHQPLSTLCPKSWAEAQDWRWSARIGSKLLGLGLRVFFHFSRPPGLPKTHFAGKGCLWGSRGPLQGPRDPQRHTLPAKCFVFVYPCHDFGWGCSLQCVESLIKCLGCAFCFCQRNSGTPGKGLSMPRHGSFCVEGSAIRGCGSVWCEADGRRTFLIGRGVCFGFGSGRPLSERIISCTSWG